MAEGWEKYDIVPVAKWSYIAKWADKISDEIERMGEWDEAIDMVGNAMAGVELDNPSDKEFYLLFEFLRNFYYRIKKWDSPQPFNKVSAGSDTKLGDIYRLHNYDYKMFHWVAEHNFMDYLSPVDVVIKKEELSPAEIQMFNKRLNH